MWDKSPVGVCITQDKHPLKKEIPEYSIAKKGGELMNNYEYIKDAFTKEENKTNLEVNHLKVECISSKSNKFELDSEGNLTVKSITTDNHQENGNNLNILNAVYPVGAIYLSVNNTHPSVLFGGTWEEIAKGRTLVGINTADTDFNIPEKTGGSKEMQRHAHTATNFVYNAVGSIDLPNGIGQKLAVASGPVSVDYAGNGNSGNLQPYFTCYMWKRTN